MGAAMARNLCRAGLDVRVWNRTRAKAEPLADDGARVDESPREAVEGADVVLTMLFDAEATSTTVRAAAPRLRPGMVWLQCTTAGLEGLEPLVELAREYQLTFIDSPVLGTRQPAEAGKLLVLASGPSSEQTGLSPVLDAIGARTVWVSEEPGAATRLKLVCNSWVLTVTHGVAEAMALADGLGVDPQNFLDAIEGGTLDMGYLRIKAEAIRSRDLTPSFSVSTAEKDAGLIVEAGRGAGVQLDVAAAGAERFRRAAEQGHAEEDMAASYFASFPADEGNAGGA